MEFKKIISDASISLLRKVVSLLRGLVLIPLITKTIGTDVYGVWTVLLSVVGVIVTVGSMHAHGALIRYSSSESEARRIGSEVSIVALCGVSLLTAVYVILELSVGLLSTQPIIGSRTAFTVWVAVLISGEAIFTVVQNIPRAQSRVKTYEVIWIARKLTETSVLFAAFWVTSNLVTAIASLALLVVLFDLVLAAKYIGTAYHLPTRERVRKYFAYGAPMIPRELSGTLLTHGDKFLILYFLSPTAVGIYAVSYSLARALYQFSGVLNSTLYPSITAAWDDGDTESINQLYSGVVRLYTILGIPAIAGVTLLSGSVLRLISTAEVTSRGQILLPLLAAGFVVYGYANPLMYVLNAAEENEKIGLITTLAAVLNIVTNVVLISMYGLLGAVVATVGAFLLITLYVVYHVRQHVRFALPLRTGLISLVATGVMTGVLLFLPVDRPFDLVAYPLVGSASYFTVFAALGGVSRRDISRIKDVIAAD